MTQQQIEIRLALLAGCAIGAAVMAVSSHRSYVAREKAFIKYDKRKTEFVEKMYKDVQDYLPREALVTLHTDAKLLNIALREGF